jgi:hypothetical protein
LRGRHATSRPYQVVDLENGKSSITHVRVDSLDTETASTVVHLYPVTGRTHQVRDWIFTLTLPGITQCIDVDLVVVFRSFAFTCNTLGIRSWATSCTAPRKEGQGNGELNHAADCSSVDVLNMFVTGRVSRLQLHAHTLRVRHVRCPRNETVITRLDSG